MNIYDGLVSVVKDYFGPAGSFLVNAILDRLVISKDKVTKEDLPKVADAVCVRGKEYNILKEDKISQMKQDILDLGKSA